VFLAQLQEIFSCICCQDLVYQPVTLECSHNFCKVSSLHRLLTRASHGRFKPGTFFVNGQGTVFQSQSPFLPYDVIIVADHVITVATHMIAVASPPQKYDDLTGSGSHGRYGAVSVSLKYRLELYCF